MSMDERGTISSPITSLTELFNLSESSLKHRFVSKPLVARTGSPREKVLLCHDMKGGYLQDKHTQGCETTEPCYRFFRWHLIDLFVYFAHELVTIPPLVWIDAAHQNGVQILGTFITEFEAGKVITDQLLASDETIDRVTNGLAMLMEWYHFDGYLLNIENPIQPEQIPRLLDFVSKVKLACAKVNPNSVIIWYDSVTIEGNLKWQNQLNQWNEPFFHTCDGIFLNYTWKPEYLLQSKIYAGQRVRDVFVGIDVFGRGCLGGGGFNTCEPMKISHELGLSTALFAPGWLFETLKGEDFVDNDRKFWTLLEPYTYSRVFQTNALSTCFSDGFGEAFFIHGQSIAEHRWYHLGIQSYLPNTGHDNQWILDHQEAYFGGSSITVQGERNGCFHLFKCAIPVQTMMEVVLVMKTGMAVTIELKCDNGSSIRLEKPDEAVTIRDWQRNTYHVNAQEPVMITDVCLLYTRNEESVLKLGYFAIRPKGIRSVKVEPTLPLVKSIEAESNQSVTLHWVDSLESNPSTMMFIFARDQFERYRFLGATRQSYFIVYQSDLTSTTNGNSRLINMEANISNLEICCLAYDQKFDQLKERIAADPDCVKKKDRDGRTALHWACSSGAKDIVHYLLEICHVRPDLPDELGWTPLMIAVSAGHLDIVRMLLATRKVDVEQSNSSGARPLHYACSKNYYEIAELLLEHDADINATDKYNQTPLDRCCSKGHHRLVELLLKHPKIDFSVHKECDGDHTLPIFAKYT